MSPKRSSARCSKSRDTGFTLSEVLVGLTIASVVILGVGSSFVFITRSSTDHQARIQAQQSLRDAVADISRELRIAGACMPLSSQPPIASNFQPIGGTNGTNDSITITANPRCAEAVVNANCNNCATISVDNTTNFVNGMWGFIVYNGTGQYFNISTVTSGSPGSLTVNPVTPINTGLYPASSSSVYGADQRTFAVSSTCTGCGGVPTLTLQTLGTAALPLVPGIDTLKVQYILNRKFSTAPTECIAQTGGTTSLCVVNLPTQAPSVAGDWQLVRALTLTLDARSAAAVRASGSADGFFHLGGAFEISPRNFLFPQAPGRL
jgi:prepilin-type N-terminal cleavage/methylation domain-containing protein